jgi:hypothetical protein
MDEDERERFSGMADHLTRCGGMINVRRDKLGIRQLSGGQDSSEQMIVMRRYGQIYR